MFKNQNTKILHKIKVLLVQIQMVCVKYLNKLTIQTWEV